jgi:mannosyltransferase
MIILDGIIFSLQKNGGISVYFKNLIKSISDNNLNATLLLNNKCVHEFDNFTNLSSICHLNSRAFERYRKCLIPMKGKVFHSSYYRQPERANIPSVVTVHDFIYERYYRGPKLWLHNYHKIAAIRSAKAVICISEATKIDLLEFVGETPGQTIHVIYNGVSEIYKKINVPPSIKPFVLFVGGRAGYKNFQLLLNTMEMLPDLNLYCVGGGSFSANEFSNISKDLLNRVCHLGSLTDLELNKFYNQAICLVYPSIYEGFGIPVIEAMRAGCPVVSVNCKAILEIGKNALTVSEDFSPEALSKAILHTVSSSRQSIIAEGFIVAKQYSWRKTFSKTMNIYNNLSL